MRAVSALMFAFVLMACGGVASGTDAVGHYRANWDEREQLVLNEDFTYRHVHADGASTTGTWLLDTSSGDTRVEMRSASEPGVSAPSIHRNMSGDVVITMSHDENRAFVKAD